MFKIDLNDYKDLHYDDHCSGEFRIKIFIDYNYFGIRDKHLRLDEILMVYCDDCGAGYIPVEVRDMLEKKYTP